MAQFDIHNLVLPTLALNFATINTNTTTNGVIIDTRDYGALEFVLATGARTDGTYTLQIQHGDDSGLSDAAVVTDASDLLGTTAATAIAAANTVKRVGYVGNKRYVRAQVVSTGASTGATVGVIAMRGAPKVGPAASN